MRLPSASNSWVIPSLRPTRPRGRSFAMYLLHIKTDTALAEETLAVRGSVDPGNAGARQKARDCQARGRLLKASVVPAWLHDAPLHGEAGQGFCRLVSDLGGGLLVRASDGELPAQLSGRFRRAVQQGQ